MESYQQGVGGGRFGEEVQGRRSITGRHKIDRGEGKNSLENGEAKELICMTHGHELRGGGEDAGGRGSTRQKGIKRRK